MARGKQDANGGTVSRITSSKILDLTLVGIDAVCAASNALFFFR